MKPLIAAIVVAVAALIGWEAMQFADIARVAKNAGFSGTDLIIAVAVAIAESSGNPQAYNPEVEAGTPSGQGSYGLWQIYLKAHPEFSGQNLYDPQINANAAYRVFQEQGWSAWSTYSSKMYLSHAIVAGAAAVEAVL